MSSPVSSEHIARIRDDARRLVRGAGYQEAQLESLVQAADADARDAAIAMEELDGSPSGAEWRLACTTRLSRALEHADAVRQTCVGAREQHIAARRLLSRFDEQRAEPRPTESRGHAAGVLVVDDIEDTRELIAFVLREAGFLVRTAVNGVDALISAYEMQPAVIVMDMMMPVLGGLEATRLIKATHATRDAKVIAYTANPALPEVLVDRLFVAVLPKPSTPDAVVAAVQNVAGL